MGSVDNASLSPAPGPVRNRPPLITMHPQGPRNAAALARTLSAAAAALLISGCGLPLKSSGSKPRPVYLNERFQADETFSRLFDADVERTCEAARRALLSQGYVIAQAEAGLVKASKRFQPEGEVHVELAFTVVCVPDGRSGGLATAYVSAQQDRYTVKKSSTSTSVGLSAIGSISMPLSSTHESLVKVASETIPAGDFYDRFFALMQKLLRDHAADERG